MKLIVGARDLFFGVFLALCISCASSSNVPLMGSSDIPAAQGTVRASVTKNGNTRLEVSVEHLAPPERIEPGTRVFIVWVKGAFADQPQNLGALAVDANLRGEIAAVTPLRSFELFITAERDQLVTNPTGQPLLRARINKE